MPKKSLPRIAAVDPDAEPFRLRIRWRQGGESVLDVSGPITTFRVYAPLRASPDLFRDVRVGEHGTDVAWTDDIDMAAATLWRLAQEQSSATMSGEVLRVVRPELAR